MIDDFVRDRARGALVGLAVGDALGCTLDSGVRITNRSHFLKDIVGGGPDELRAGQWTDETAQALALGDALLACSGRLDTDAVMSRWLDWRRVGKYSCTDSCIGIGDQMQWALDRYEAVGEGNGYEAPIQPECHKSDGIGRLAPAVLAGRDLQEAITLAQAQSSLTHNSRTCQDVAGHMADQLWYSIRGGRQPKVPWTTYERSRTRVRTSGNVVDIYEAALWCVSRTLDFRDCLVEAVNLGYAASRVGAVAGQLAGARYGMSGIPPEWLERLAWCRRIVDMADDLLEMRGRSRPSVPLEGDRIDHTPDWGFNGQKY